MGPRRSLPVPANGPARPEVAALHEAIPSVADLFTFMRDAELRFATLRMRIEERSATARGEEVATVEASLAHPAGHGPSPRGPSRASAPTRCG